MYIYIYIYNIYTCMVTYMYIYMCIHVYELVGVWTYVALKSFNHGQMGRWSPMTCMTWGKHGYSERGMVKGNWRDFPLPSGKSLHNDGKIHHIFNGKTHCKMGIFQFANGKRLPGRVCSRLQHFWPSGSLGMWDFPAELMTVEFACHNSLITMELPGKGTCSHGVKANSHRYVSYVNY